MADRLTKVTLELSGRGINRSLGHLLFGLVALGLVSCRPSATTAPSSPSYIKASNTGAGDRFGFSLVLSGDGKMLAVGAINEDSAARGVNGNQDDNSAEEAGAVYVFTHGTAWSQQAYLKASNAGAGDEFGSSLALSSDNSTLAVGAPLEDSGSAGVNGDQGDDSTSESGAAYVFVRAGDRWSQQAYLKASNPGTGDRFGTSLALSGDGNTLAVGARNEASAATGINGSQADDSAAGAGAVYVFVRSGSVWTQQAYIKASNTGASDGFGVSLALSDDGNTLAVGAPLEDSGATGINGNQSDDSAGEAGAVYVFQRNGGVWTQQAYVKASNTGASDEFGVSVALSADGNTLAVGAPGEFSAATGVNGNQADNSSPGAGAVYVFTHRNGAWSQQAYVKASNARGFDEFGISVALSRDGNTLAVGAFGEQGTGTGVNGDQTYHPDFSDAGAAYLFSRSGAAWSQRSYVKATNTEPFDEFGVRVALNATGTVLAVAADLESSAATGVNGDQKDNSAPEAGAVYAY